MIDAESPRTPRDAARPAEQRVAAMPLQEPCARLEDVQVGGSAGVQDEPVG